MEQPILKTHLSSFENLPHSAWTDALRNLLRSKASLVSLLVVLLFLGVAAAAPWIVPYNPNRQDPPRDYLPPFWVERSISGQAGSIDHLLGTDVLGRDVLSRLIYGARTSLVISLTTVAVTVLFGTLIGSISGYFGGKIDQAIMQIVNILYAFPTLLFYIMIILILRGTAWANAGNGLNILLVTLILIGWVGIARLIRSAVMVLKGETYVEAARSLGASPLQLIFKHILPNCFHLVLVWITFTIPRIILIEATLGYLGIGFTPTGNPMEFFVTSWGGMILDGRQAISYAPWVIFSAAVCIGLVSMAFTYLGDGLRNALDPRIRDL